ncbi:hypothetical protein V8E53_003061 [Lactarius tabidus]
MLWLWTSFRSCLVTRVTQSWGFDTASSHFWLNQPPYVPYTCSLVYGSRSRLCKFLPSLRLMRSRVYGSKSQLPRKDNPRRQQEGISRKNGKCQSPKRET